MTTRANRSHVFAAIVFLLGLIAYASTAHADESKTYANMIDPGDTQVSLVDLNQGETRTITVHANASWATVASVQCMLIDDRTNLVLYSISLSGSCRFTFTAKHKGLYAMTVKNLEKKSPILSITRWE